MTAIKIAFGRGGLSSPDPSWSRNDTSEVGTNGVMYADLLDENGVPTGVSMSCSAALSGQGTSTASSGAGGWPVSSFQRHAFITSGSTRTFTFSGLPPSTSVTLLFAGHRGASATRDSNFTFGGVAGFYDQSGTATPTTPTSVVGVTNGSGVITLVFEAVTLPDTAYISAISLTWGATPPNTAKISYYLSDSQSTTATVAFRAIGGGSVALKYSTNSNFSGSTTTSPITSDSSTDYLVKFNLTGLTPDTTYYYQAVQDGFDDLSLTASGAVIPKFKTSKTGQLDFKMALSSCALSESTSRVFDRIRARNPDVFVHHGDLHYADIATNDVALKRAAYLSSMQTKVQNNFFRSCPIWYRYDDHDYGTNNSNSSYVGKVASAATVREIFPQVRAVSSGAIYYATTRGRVRFIQLDTRYEKNGPAMLGATQKTWFKNELTAAAALIDTGELGLVIVDTSIPWIALAATDSWSDTEAERTELADHIWSLGLNTNIAFVAGDMHGCAYDDGTNNKYDTSARVGWPVIQSGALDNSGSSKGGPYTSGIFQGGGQYSILDIADNGSTIDCSVVAYSSADAALYSASFSVYAVVPAAPSSGGGLTSAGLTSSGLTRVGLTSAGL